MLKVLKFLFSFNSGILYDKYYNLSKTGFYIFEELEFYEFILFFLNNKRKIELNKNLRHTHLKFLLFHK